MQSERDLVCRELEALLDKRPVDAAEWRTIMDAAKLLREGGQK